jgi:hypothetical protein
MAAVLYSNSGANLEYANEALPMLKRAVKLLFNPNGFSFPLLANNLEFEAICEASKNNRPPPFGWFLDPIGD